MYVYVASSWRNQRQPAVVQALKHAGHEVYDFRHPEPGNDGFQWSAIDPAWQNWSPEQYRKALDHPVAKRGFALDMGALRRCDCCLYILPCGRSASLELGWAAGAGKLTVALLADAEPELMLALVDRICVDLDEVLTFLAQVQAEGIRNELVEQAYREQR